MDPQKFRKQLASTLVESLSKVEGVHAIWEGGSSATGTADEYSDIDFNVLADSSEDTVFSRIEETLKSISPIQHIYHEPKSLWPDLTQKIYILEKSPKYFFLDVAFFPVSAPHILKEFLQVERHGTPVVHYDKHSQIKTTNGNKEVLAKKHQQRVLDIKGCFPVYRTTVLKELARHNEVDAFAFYQAGMVRPLIELLGILHRPFQSDFGLRYLKRSLPNDVFENVRHLVYVADPDDLRTKVEELEILFHKTLEQLDGRFTSN